MNKSILANVKFSVVTFAYDEDISMNVPQEDPVLRNLTAHLQDLFTDLERRHTGSDLNRTIRFRMSVRASQAVIDGLTAGTIIRITHKKHSVSNGWVRVTTDEQYLVQDVANIDPTGKYVNIGLIVREASR